MMLITVALLSGWMDIRFCDRGYLDWI